MRAKSTSLSEKGLEASGVGRKSVGKSVFELWKQTFVAPPRKQRGSASARPPASRAANNTRGGGGGGGAAGDTQPPAASRTRSGGGDDGESLAPKEGLTSAEQLLHLTEYEVGWRAQLMGANQPGLLCARLYGERLGDWSSCAEIAKGVLSIEPFNPLLRAEATRLLGRAHFALGAQAAACEAAERAAAEAAKAKYGWFEMLALADLVKWSEAGEKEGVRVRLRSVTERLVASEEELAEVLGEGEFMVDVGLAPESSRLKKVSKLLESCKINPTMRFSVEF